MTRNINEIMSAFEERIEGQGKWLMLHDPNCFKEQKHTQEPDGVPTPERIYWHYGYRTALKDVLEILKKNEIT